MMLKNLKKLKPGVSRRTHLLMAALIWPVAGTFVFYRGFGWIASTNRYWLVLIGVAGGSIKSFFILDRTARKSINRILQFGDNTCLGAVYSLKTWMMVFAMITAGIVLRHLDMPLQLLGTLYVAIGWGLLLSSRHAWLKWYEMISHDDRKKDNQGVS